MKKITSLFTLLSLSTSVALAAEPILLDKIAVIVNDQIITESQIFNETQSRLRILARQNRSAPEAAIRAEVTQQLINEELQMQQANRQNIRIDNIALDREIERIARQQGGTVEQLFQEITSNGDDYIQFREGVRRQMAIQQTFVREVRREVKISSQEITDYLNSDINPRVRNAEYQLKHIALTLSDSETAQTDTIEQANALYQRLVAGEDFADLAFEYSQAETALQRGELGWLNRSQLPNRFMAEIFSMDVGAISQPFTTDNTVNILQLSDIRGVDKTVIDEVKARHILIQISEITDENMALNEINALRSRIVAGEDFGDLAIEFSDDSVSASLRGELNWNPASIYVPEFQRVVNDIPLNTLSEPFKTVFGWHIVEVQDRRTVDQTMQTLREQAEVDLLNRKAGEQQDLWVARLRNNAFIEIRD